jgi:pyridinium-3,5-biscarboxylic acid mononucleotide sulfurtransferase
MRATKKLNDLRNILKAMDSALLAFSGGADSSLLLAVSSEVLKHKLIAVTGISPAIPPGEISQAVSLAKKLKVRHLLLKDVPPKEFWANSGQRCYYCKKALFVRLKRLAAKEKLRWVIDATNSDDYRDFRPGVLALEELGVRSPLKEAGFTKPAIRSLSRSMGLLSWDKPAMACLASRIPYGERITPEKLLLVDKAEQFIRSLGASQVRVRLQGKLARIEVLPRQMPLVMRKAKSIAAKLKSMGFSYVTIDLQGYRTGSLNEALKWKRKK